MPAIVIKDYAWRQTSEFVIVHIPLPGNPKKVDLFVMDNYVKASFPPFILELFLWALVLEEQSKCTITDKEAILFLQKAEIDVEWPLLEVEDIDREIKREYRDKAFERAQKLAKDRAESKSERRRYLQKEAIKAQINVDTTTLNKINAMRDAHRKEAMQEFEDWRTSAELPILQDIKGKVQKNRNAYRRPLKWFKDTDGTIQSRELTNAEIFDDNSGTVSSPSIGLKQLEWRKTETESDGASENKIETCDSEIAEPEPEQEKSAANTIKSETTVSEDVKQLSDTSDDSSCSEDSGSEFKEESSDKFVPKSLVKEVDGKALNKFYKQQRKERPGKELIDRILNGKFAKRNSIFEEPSKSVPLPRKSSTINVTFSERAFPTPARESSHLQEQEWLAKQVEARRKTGFIAEDLRPEERDPQWLKDKGDEFFQAGNYLAAISAYTHGIKISDKMASLYVNRSAAQYALENYYRCVEDCTTALELMEPKCEGNRGSRARCHARRGAALCKLSAPQHGIPELEAALKLAPNNESIKRDLVAARQYFDVKE